MSLSARDPEGRDADYIEWHSLDHRPEQHRLDGLRGALRLVSTPACRAARLPGDERFDAVDHVMAYLFAGWSALRPFGALGGALAAGGRMPRMLPSVEIALYDLAGTAAAPAALVGADVVPWRPATGAFLLVERVGGAGEGAGRGPVGGDGEGVGRGPVGGAGDGVGRGPVGGGSVAGDGVGRGPVGGGSVGVGPVDVGPVDGGPVGGDGGGSVGDGSVGDGSVGDGSVGSGDGGGSVDGGSVGGGPGSGSPADLVAVPGVAGAWSFAGPAEPPSWSADVAGLQLTWCFLDGDPVEAAGRLRAPLERRWAGGAAAPLLAAPFHVPVPFDWSRHVPGA